MPLATGHEGWSGASAVAGELDDDGSASDGELKAHKGGPAAKAIEHGVPFDGAARHAQKVTERTSRRIDQELDQTLNSLLMTHAAAQVQERPARRTSRVETSLGDGDGQGDADKLSQKVSRLDRFAVGGREEQEPASRRSSTGGASSASWASNADSLRRKVHSVLEKSNTFKEMVKSERRHEAAERAVSPGADSEWGENTDSDSDTEWWQELKIRMEGA